MADPKRERALTARNKSSAAKYRPSKNGTGTGEGLRQVGTLHVCWCGEPSGHDWPGKADGEAHPR